MDNLNQRKLFVIREATRNGGNIDLAYEINKETNKIKIREVLCKEAVDNRKLPFVYKN